MRFTRSTPALAVLFALSVLAACGGGGGGGTVTPPGGGGGGGPTPTSAPTATPTASSAPTPTPAPSLSPTAAPTATPKPTPPPTPTPVPSASPSRTTIYAGEGEIAGNDTMFTDGVSAAHEVSDGDYPAGGHGPLNSTIGPDNVPCLSSMYAGPIATPGGGYHVHSFLGILYNGSRIAVPDGIGLADPEGDALFQPHPNASPTPPPIPNWTNYATTCYYEIHTHDSSGLVHIEAAPPAPPGLFDGQYGTKYTVGDLLAIWGIPVTPTNWGPLNGNVTIYTSGPVARGGPPASATNDIVYSNLYQLICNGCTAAQAGAIPLYSHEVIWVLVGTGNPIGSSLPNVKFSIEW